MPSFDAWYDWAISRDTDPAVHAAEAETWRWVAENARAEACYEDPATHDAYKEVLGRENPNSKTAFRLCYGDFQLSGAPVPEQPPPFLTRCLRRQVLNNRIRETLRDQGAGVDPLGVGQQEYEVDIVDLDTEAWHLLATCVVMEDEQYALGVHLGYYEARSVFATFDVEDAVPPDAGHQPGFWQTIRGERRRGRTVAGEAVYRLALASAREQVAQEWLLLYYDAAGLMPCRYPVPPDAGFSARFRPVAPADGHPFGRTCPGPRDACDEDLAHDEVVHANHPVAYDDIWIVSLGSTSSE